MVEPEMTQRAGQAPSSQLPEWDDFVRRVWDGRPAPDTVEAGRGALLISACSVAFGWPEQSDVIRLTHRLASFLESLPCSCRPTARVEGACGRCEQLGRMFDRPLTTSPEVSTDGD